RPVIRTLKNVPATVTLITTAQAAAMLGVTPRTVLIYVLSGRLFAWQKEIGKCGCRVYFSQDQVMRYADDPRRLERRARWDRYVEAKETGELGETAMVSWERFGIEPQSLREPSAYTERNYGEYYTQRQVAL